MDASSHTKAAPVRSALRDSEYQVRAVLGEGSFGKVLLATWRGEEVAVKIEDCTRRFDQLEGEFNLLRSLQAGIGIPEVYDFTTIGNYKVMAMELLGKDLHALFSECGKHFEPAFILQLGLQMLQRLEFIHSRGVLHRDLKPDNFLLGRGLEGKRLYLVDFGIARRFRDGLDHAPFRTNVPLRGTAKFCSINTLKGCEQSRRDDLESLAYVLLHLVHGRLPWDSFRHAETELYRRGVCNLKQEANLPELCYGPFQCLSRYITYCRSLAYEARPDYKYLKRLFTGALEALGGEAVKAGLVLPVPAANGKEEKTGELEAEVPVAPLIQV